MRFGLHRPRQATDEVWDACTDFGKGEFVLITKPCCWRCGVVVCTFR